MNKKKINRIITLISPHYKIAMNYKSREKMFTIDSL